MLIQRIFMLLIFILTGTFAFAAAEADLKIMSAKSGANVLVDRVLEEGKVVISVIDAEKKPLFGLQATDFTVTQAGRTAKVISVQPLAESLDIPRHIVLVLDNSSSMKQREAVKALLAGVDELLKIVRPIDDVRIVVFDDEKSVKMGGRDLHVRTFKSSNPAELRDYAIKTYRDGMTNNTVLFEGMLAGLELVSAMPAAEPRFMVVFSDGEDINSAFKAEDVLKVAEGVGRFNAYTIDYMPGSEKNRLLDSFATKNNGQIWKAASETNLVEIFQSVASKMQYFYLLSYQFPPTGRLAVDQATLTLDEIMADVVDPVTGKTPALNDKAAPAEVAGLFSKIDSSNLLLRPVIDSVYGIARWKVVVTNARGAVAELAGEGTPQPELVVPLPTADLQALAAGGDLQVRMDIEDRKAQHLILSTPPVKMNVAKTSASLAVTPSALTFEDIRSGNAPADIKIDASALKLKPVVSQGYGAVGWKVNLSNAKGKVAEQAGVGVPPAEIMLALPTGDLQSLASGGDIAVSMELMNSRNQKLVLQSRAVKVNVMQSRTNLSVSPASLTIEEIKTIDASPMLGQIYFDKGAAEIHSRYLRFNSPDETKGFDEQKFRDTLEKYYQLLNIVGKRMVDNPTSAINLVGCNDNTGEEKGKKKLSGQRAEAVKNYLQTIWNIAPERIAVQSRNLPATPSTSKSKEGQSENRRVEIHSADPAILAPIRSTYLATRIDSPELTLKPEVTSAHGIASWKISSSNSTVKFADLTGTGTPGKELKVQMPTGGELRSLATGGDVEVQFELQDLKGQKMIVAAPPVKINFIETSKRLAQKQDQLVQEKYALILFDFDKDTVGGANQEIINKIVTRIKTLPQASVEIVGHTDNIGKESYNTKLSERRALAVYKQLKAAYGESATDRIRYSGVGPKTPLYENVSPETRSFNRTVTITLEYLSAE